MAPETLQPEDNELDDLNRKIPIGEHDLPNKVYLEFRKANIKFPQTVIGTTIKCVAEILRSQEVDLLHLENYGFNQLQLQDLLTTMNEIHRRIGVREVDLQELTSTVESAMRPLLRNLSTYVSNLNGDEIKLSKLKTFFSRASQLLDDERIRKSAAERWAKVKDQPPTARFEFGRNILEFSIRDALFSEFVDEYLFLKKQIISRT